MQVLVMLMLIITEKLYEILFKEDRIDGLILVK